MHQLSFPIIGTVSFLTLSASAQTSSVNCVALQRGGEYYRFVSIPSNITAFLSRDVKQHDPIRLALHAILSARQQNETVFSDFHRYLQWCVSRFNPQTGDYFYRPGHFYGFMEIFCRIGPERSSWNFYLLAQDGSLKRSMTDRVFSETEIEAGKLRNRAARMALLETIIKGMDNLGGYEQAEIIDVAQDFWIRTRKPKDADINVSAVLDAMAKSGFLHPVAMLHLGKDKYSQKELREIYNRLLEDTNSPGLDYYDSYVKEAVEFLKTHHPQDLEKADTNLPWKRALIDVARGHPCQEWRRDDAAQGNSVETLEF